MIATPGHPIITGINGGANGGQILDTGLRTDLDGYGHSAAGHFTNVPSGATTVLRDNLNRPLMIEYPYGKGRVFASMMVIEFQYDSWNNKKLLANEIGYQASICIPNRLPPFPPSNCPS
jgi:hypothetical protein